MSDRYYRSAEWRALRAAVLRPDPICRTPGCERPSQHVDHIVPRRQGGSDTMGNLRGLCASCHSTVTRQGNAKPLRVKGCDASGMPLDPSHPWNRGR